MAFVMRNRLSVKYQLAASGIYKFNEGKSYENWFEERFFFHDEFKVKSCLEVSWKLRLAFSNGHVAITKVKECFIFFADK